MKSFCVGTAEMIFPMSSLGINQAMMTQQIVYRLISLCKNNPDRDKGEIVRSVYDGLFTLPGQLGLKIEHKFDEEIWPPDRPERFGKVVQFFIGSATSAYLILEVDLTKGYHDCATLVSDKGNISFDPFRVSFKED